MTHRTRRPAPALLAAWAVLLLTPQSGRADDPPGPPDAFAAARKLGRGVNLGNILEAPSEGAWGLTLDPEFFGAIRRAGFDSVRIPIRWGVRAGEADPWTIDPAFFARVDAALDEATRQGLAVVINLHHDELGENEPAKYLDRAASFWRQVAGRYRDRPSSVVFELLNEPHAAMTDELWQATFPALLAAVRETNPTRAVVVGPGHWNGLGSLPKLALPEDDRRLIVTFHYYSPFEFTHQGAEWAEGADKWLGRTWAGTPEEMAALRGDLDKALAYGRDHNRPLYLGEFGAYNKAPADSRVAWTAAVAREAEARGFAWAYWEFAAGFGIYDPTTREFRAPLLRALLPDAKVDPAPAPAAAPGRP